LRREQGGCEDKGGGENVQRREWNGFHNGHTIPGPEGVSREFRNFQLSETKLRGGR
jgi:hypothetical protein